MLDGADLCFNSDMHNQSDHNGTGHVLSLSMIKGMFLVRFRAGQTGFTYVDKRDRSIVGVTGRNEFGQRIFVDRQKSERLFKIVYVLNTLYLKCLYIIQ